MLGCNFCRWRFRSQIARYEAWEKFGGKRVCWSGGCVCCDSGGCCGCCCPEFSWRECVACSKCSASIRKRGARASGGKIQTKSEADFAGDSGEVCRCPRAERDHVCARFHANRRKILFGNDGHGCRLDRL